MKMGSIDVRIPSVIPEGVLVDSIRSFMKNSKYPKSLVIKKFDMLLEKYQAKQKEIAEEIIAARESNKNTQKSIEKIRSKNKGVVFEIREKLS